MSEMENTTIPFPELHQLVYPALMGLAFNELDNSVKHFGEVDHADHVRPRTFIAQGKI